MKRTELIEHLRQHFKNRAEMVAFINEVYPPKSKFKIEEAEDFILEKLRTGPKQSKMMVTWAKRRSIAQGTLYMALRSLRADVVRKVTGFGPERASYWQMRDDQS